MRLALVAGLALSALMSGSALAQTAPALSGAPAPTIAPAPRTAAPARKAPPAATAAPAAAADPAATADPAAAPRAAAKPKKRGPTPASAVIVQNASAHTATSVTITGEGKDAKVSKPLKSNAKTTVKLPKLKGCMVSVAATFEGEAQADLGEFDVCKDKNIRFTD
jgi:hypothetical protein